MPRNDVWAILVEKIEGTLGTSPSAIQWRRRFSPNEQLELVVSWLEKGMALDRAWLVCMAKTGIGPEQLEVLFSRRGDLLAEFANGRMTMAEICRLAAQDTWSVGN